MLNVIKVNVVILNVIILNVAMLSVVILNAIMLSVVAPLAGIIESAPSSRNKDTR